MIEKWEKIDQGCVFGALLTDVYKGFGCIPHDLIITKLETYGFEIGVLIRLIHAYLINRKQKIKVNKVNSSWKDIIFGIPQRNGKKRKVSLETWTEPAVFSL